VGAILEEPEQGQEEEQGWTSMTQTRDQLRNQPLSDLEASSISTVGGRIFPDTAAMGDLGALLQIVEAWRDVHAPTYGAPIPGTGDTAVHQFELPNTIETVFAASAGTVASVQMITVQNAGAGSIVLDLFLTDADGTNIDVLDDLNIAAGEVVNLMTNASIGFPQFFADESLQIRGRVVTGTPGDCYAKVNYILTVQG